VRRKGQTQEMKIPSEALRTAFLIRETDNGFFDAHWVNGGIIASSFASAQQALGRAARRLLKRHGAQMSDVEAIAEIRSILSDMASRQDRDLLNQEAVSNG
jgi:hypothetical protein